MVWIQRAVIALLAVGAFGIGYVMFSAMGKPDAPQNLARYSTGALEKLRVLSEPPPRPSVIFIDGDGYGTTLDAFGRKTLLVNFWATWCAPCVAEMPSLAELQRQKGSERFEVVAISMNNAAQREEAREFLFELTGGDLAFYQDPNLKLPFTIDAMEGLPVTILYDPDGRELARLQGGADWASPEAFALIDAAVGG